MGRSSPLWRVGIALSQIWEGWDGSHRLEVAKVKLLEVERDASGVKVGCEGGVGHPIVSEADVTELDRGEGGINAALNMSSLPFAFASDGARSD
eukprot:CAMPEP_0196159302 /NCGR_PEP_ID=MMETSP0910-20130528/46252_1 /TAXON_ID=49265 /ORGANISM="Thalassiosira rotula, Strain GSO102" /LENGTH=93 /DNA_ID=CAMNT_0041424219 /DNA_START=671 /DNA_END=948 /DNA_ORIENTATION=+